MSNQGSYFPGFLLKDHQKLTVYEFTNLFGPSFDNFEVIFVGIFGSNICIFDYTGFLFDYGRRTYM